MGWTTPHTFVTGEVVTAATMNTYVSNDLSDLDRRTTGHRGTVATSETTTSATFTDLATSGPAATATIGVSGTALVILTANMGNNTGTAYALMGFAVSGATTVAAADTQSLSIQNPSNPRGSAAYFVTGLTAGSNTFTAKYRSTAGTATFGDRNIIVVPLGS